MASPPSGGGAGAVGGASFVLKLKLDSLERDYKLAQTVVQSSNEKIRAEIERTMTQSELFVTRAARNIDLALKGDTLSAYKNDIAAIGEELTKTFKAFENNDAVDSIESIDKSLSALSTVIKDARVEIDGLRADFILTGTDGSDQIAALRTNLTKLEQAQVQIANARQNIIKTLRAATAEPAEVVKTAIQAVPFSEEERQLAIQKRFQAQARAEEALVQGPPAPISKTAIQELKEQNAIIKEVRAQAELLRRELAALGLTPIIPKTQVQELKEFNLVIKEFQAGINLAIKNGTAIGPPVPKTNIESLKEYNAQIKDYETGQELARKQGTFIGPPVPKSYIDQLKELVAVEKEEIAQKEVIERQQRAAGTFIPPPPVATIPKLTQVQEANQKIIQQYKDQKKFAEEAAKAQAILQGTDPDLVTKKTKSYGDVLKETLDISARYLIVGGAISKVMQGIGAAFTFAKESTIDYNNELEKNAAIFSRTTGNIEKATELVKDLQNKGSDSEFRIFKFDDLIEGEKKLKEFGQDTEEQRRRVGDVAAQLGLTFAQSAEKLTIVSDRIKHGLPAGQYLRELARAGILTGEWAEKIVAAEQAGASADQILDLFNQSLLKYNGAMKDVAATTASTAQGTDNLKKQLAASVGEPFYRAYQLGLNELNTSLNDPETKKTLDYLHDALTNLLTLNFVGVIKVNLLTAKGLIFKWIDDIADALHVPFHIDLTGVISDINKAREELKTNAQNVLPTAISSVLKPDSQPIVDAYTTIGVSSAKAFLGGFTSIDFNELDKLSTIAEQALTGSLSTKTNLNIKDKISELQPIFADIIEEIRQFGHITSGEFVQISTQVGNLDDGLYQTKDTLKELQNALSTNPEAFNAIKNYVEQLARLKIATDQAAVSDRVLTAAQDALAKVTKDVGDELNTQKQVVQDLQDKQQEAAAGAQKIIDTQQRVVDNISRQAQDASQHWDDILNPLQRNLQDLQNVAKDNKKYFSDMLQPLTDEQEKLQKTAEEHSKVFAAIQAGETDEFLRQNTAIDNQTKAIIARFNAEVQGVLRAKTAADKNVLGIEQKERRELLAIEEKIRAERSKGTPAGEAAARALEDEKKRVTDRYNYQLDLERQRAAVANDNFTNEKNKVDEAAKASSDADQEKIAANKTQIDQINEQAKLQERKDQAAIDSAQKQLKILQRQADEEKDSYDRQIRIAQRKLDDLNREKQAQDVIDKAELDKEQDKLRVVQRRYDLLTLIGKDAVQQAQDAKTASDKELKNQQDITTAISDRIQYMEKVNQLALEALNIHRAENGLPPLTIDDIRNNTRPKPPENPAIGPSTNQPSTGNASARSGNLLSLTAPSRTTPLATTANAASTSPALNGVLAYSATGNSIVVAPQVHFHNARFNSDVEVEKAVSSGVKKGADQSATLLLSALRQDRLSGGSHGSDV